jgi:hypothetical protein
VDVVRRHKNCWVKLNRMGDTSEGLSEMLNLTFLTPGRSFADTPFNDGCHLMEATTARLTPLSILFAVPPGKDDLAAMLEATHGHFALVCPDVHQVLEAAHSYQPDVVVIDPTIPGWKRLAQELSSTFGRRQLTLVLLKSQDVVLRGHAKQRDFDWELPCPVLSSEFERLLWAICQKRHSVKNLKCNDNEEMIG